METQTSGPEKTVTPDTGNSFFKTTFQLMSCSLHQVIYGKHQNQILYSTWMTLTTLTLTFFQLYTCSCNLNNNARLTTFPYFSTNLTKQPQPQLAQIKSVVSVHCSFSLHVNSDRFLNSPLPCAVGYTKHVRFPLHIVPLRACSATAESSG